MAYHKLFSNKNIKDYNKDVHIGLTGKDLFTLDESEVEDFKQWIIKKYHDII